MTTLTKTEIKWIADLAKNKSEMWREQADNSPIPFNSIAQIHYENMMNIYDKLERLLKDGGKRIAIK